VLSWQLFSVGYLLSRHLG